MTLLRGVASEAAEHAYTGVEGAPGRRRRCSTRRCAHPSADLPERAERMVRDWQRGVLELVRVEGGDKRFVARTAAYAVNATGLAVMIAVFASTAFIPTGLELATGAGTTVAAQEVLEAIFGDQAVRTLAAKARADLLDRVRTLLDAEADRFLSRTADARPAADAGDGLRRAAGRVELARHRSGLSAPPTRRVPGEQHRRPGTRGVPRRPAGRRRRADRPAGRGAPVPDRRGRSYLPDADLVPAHTLVERAGTRLALSRDHTVVALAGATGSGKSSLFNALARLELSPVGVRRPTTGVAHACVWGPLEGANRLLDWLGVLPRHRFVRESALDARRRGGPARAGPARPARLRLGRSASHRLEVDRLLGLVDQVVWVVDPQKYADRVIARQLPARVPPAPRRHRRGAQPGRPAAPGRGAPGPRRPARLLDDGRADRGAGAGHLRHRSRPCWSSCATPWRRTVAERQAALRRLAGDLDTVVAGWRDWSARPGRRGRGRTAPTVNGS